MRPLALHHDVQGHVGASDRTDERETPVEIGNRVDSQSSKINGFEENRTPLTSWDTHGKCVDDQERRLLIF